MPDELIANPINSEGGSEPEENYSRSGSLAIHYNEIYWGSAESRSNCDGLLLWSRCRPCGATSGFAYDWISEAVLPLAEIIFVVLGFTLIIRRHASMRNYWQVLLTITIIFQLVHAFTEEEWFASISIALFNLGWLSYWHFSGKPAELINGNKAS